MIPTTSFQQKLLNSRNFRFLNKFYEKSQTSSVVCIILIKKKMKVIIAYQNQLVIGLIITNNEHFCLRLLQNNDFSFLSRERVYVKIKSMIH